MLIRSFGGRGRQCARGSLSARWSIHRGEGSRTTVKESMRRIRTPSKVGQRTIRFLPKFAQIPRPESGCRVTILQEMTTAVTDSPPTDAPQHKSTTTPAAQSSRGGAPRDAELLRRFVRLKDETAFAEMVRRYSRLVIGVCRRVLRSEHDIEDAFQATFLVLARDAGRIKKSASLASWLHGVAYRTSLRAAGSSRRRRQLLRDITMTQKANDNPYRDGPFAELEDRDQRQALDEELAALPENYRAPLVQHYLEGKSTAVPRNCATSPRASDRRALPSA